jgi:hypothetical protein
MTIGLLPASGSAKRLGGLPKFSLPVNETSSLLEYHVRLMEEVCDEIRISTRLDWLPILSNMKLNNATIVEYEPSTMLDATERLAKIGGEEFIVGMPDTFFLNFHENPYASLAKCDKDLALGLWDCDESLRGKVGQVRIETQGRVAEIVDKSSSCTFPDMWGAFKFNAKYSFDLSLENPSLQFQKWIDNGEYLESCRIQGRYMDAGSFAGVKELYKAL